MAIRCKYWDAGRGCKKGEHCPNLHAEDKDADNMCRRAWEPGRGCDGIGCCRIHPGMVMGKVAHMRAVLAEHREQSSAGPARAVAAPARTASQPTPDSWTEAICDNIITDNMSLQELIDVHFHVDSLRRHFDPNEDVFFSTPVKALAREVYVMLCNKADGIKQQIKDKQAEILLQQ